MSEWIESDDDEWIEEASRQDLQEALKESQAQVNGLARALARVGGIESQDLAFGRWWHQCRTCEQGFASSDYVPDLAELQHKGGCVAEFAVEHVAALEDQC